MKKNIFISIFFVISVCARIGAATLNVGIAPGADSLLFSVTCKTSDSMEIGLESGPAWEREADFTMNDWHLRTFFKWDPFYSVWYMPYLAILGELFFVDTGYEKITVPGAGIGIGYDLKVFSNNSLSLKGGIQLAGKDFPVEKEIEGFKVSHIDTWDAPLFWLSFGWHYSFRF